MIKTDQHLMSSTNNFTAMDRLKIAKSNFIQTGNNLIDKSYVIHENDKDPDEKDPSFLGQGGYGKVIRAQHKITGEDRAIKVIPKCKLKSFDRLKVEIESMKLLDHPNIVKFYEAFEDYKNVYLVMELCEGGEVFDQIAEMGHFSEAQARRVFLQMCRALTYCHKNGICHRDLKPENFLIKDKEEESPIKLIDFGLSKMYKPIEDLFCCKQHQSNGTSLGDACKSTTPKQDKLASLKEMPQRKKNTMTSRVGTLQYIAPEVLQGSYNELCDVWSLGVILYTLVSGIPAFYGDTQMEVANNIVDCKFTFKWKVWEQVSDNCKSLIKALLKPANQRLTLQQTLDHVWCKLMVKEYLYGGVASKDQSMNVAHLKEYVEKNKFKKIALNCIAQQINEKEIKELVNMFYEIDENKDGDISYNELVTAIGKAIQDAAKVQNIKKIFSEMDVDKDGLVNYTEFIAASMKNEIYTQDKKILSAFRVFDVENKGYITKKHIKRVLDVKQTLLKETEIPDVYAQLLSQADLDGDGKITYQEFKQLLTE